MDQRGFLDEPVTVDSADQDNRVQARRLRIEQRKKEKKDAKEGDKEGFKEGSKRNGRKTRVDKSLALLEKKKAETHEELTSVRVETDYMESQRRIQEDKRRHRRLKVLQEEALSSSNNGAQVEMNWSELFKKSLPLELYEEMKKQKQSCEGIIQSKDEVIATLQRELKVKDEEYVKSLKRQGEDIEMLLGRMSTQYRELQLEYEQEIEAIENAFLEERNEIISKNKNEIDSLFEKRRMMELHCMEVKQEREAQYQQELDELRKKDAEDYNQLKIKLETDIQTLEQQLEEMRATYQLNTEKLEYNYRVLTERDMENSVTLTQQKRKLARLKDTLSSLASKYQQVDTKYKNENTELTEEYRRITKQYKDLQIKFRHFETNDNQRYRSVWNMHREEILEQVQRLMKADCVIHEQQLGVAWQPPSTDVFECRSSAVARKQQAASNATPLAASDTSGKKSVNDGVSSIEKAKVSNAKLKYLLELLSSEAGFLLDSNVKNQLKSMDSEAAAVLRADSILKTLNVAAAADVKTLLTYFFESAEESEEESFALEQAGDKKAALETLGLKIKPHDVVKVLTLFAAERKCGESGTAGKSKKTGDPSRDRDRPFEEQRAQDRKEETEYWSRLVEIVPERTCKVWTALESALQKYTQCLRDRKESIDEVESLAQQNTQLKQLLSQYAGSQVMEDLLIPPTHTT